MNLEAWIKATKEMGWSEAIPRIETNWQIAKLLGYEGLYIIYPRDPGVAGMLPGESEPHELPSWYSDVDKAIKLIEALPDTYQSHFKRWISVSGNCFWQVEIVDTESQIPKGKGNHKNLSVSICEAWLDWYKRKTFKGL